MQFNFARKILVHGGYIVSNFVLLIHAITGADFIITKKSDLNTTRPHCNAGYYVASVAHKLRPPLDFERKLNTSSIMVVTAFIETQLRLNKYLKLLLIV